VNCDVLCIACKCVLPPGANQIAVDKYININYYRKYACFHRDSASADTANNDMNFICLHYLQGAQFLISLQFIFISRQLFQALYFRSFWSSRVINIYFVLNMPRKWKSHWDYWAHFPPLNHAFTLICFTHFGTIGAVMVWFVIKLYAACTECFGDIMWIRGLWRPRLPDLNPCNQSIRWSL
jgi:hypothetical protein